MKSFCVLNMTVSKAAGENIGAALCEALGLKIGFMNDSSSQAKKLSADTACGVVGAGGSAIDLGCGFEAQLITLISHYSLDAGVFIGENSGCIMSVYDCFGKPLDEKKEAEISSAVALGVLGCAEGRKIEVSGGDAYYRRLIEAGTSFENVAFSVESRNSEILKIVRRASVALGGGTAVKPRFFLSASGLCISAQDEEGGIHTGDELLSVCCACKLSEKQMLNVCFDAPACLDDIAGKEGVSLERSFSGGRELWQNDSVFLLAELLKIMSLRGVGLAQLCRIMPNVVTKRKTVLAQANLSALADMVSCNELILEEGKGVFTRMDSGIALLTPCRSSGKYCLEVQAANSEAAAELCEGIEKAVSLTNSST